MIIKDMLHIDVPTKGVTFTIYCDDLEGCRKALVRHNYRGTPLGAFNEKSELVALVTQKGYRFP